MAEPYDANHVAAALGICRTTLYRTLDERCTRDGLPRPLSGRGRLKWEPAGFDAWLTRNDPRRPSAPANDITAPLAPATIEEYRARFAREYGSAGA